jgi:pimeloyl-ACP methyl ester carboxylesterase
MLKMVMSRTLASKVDPANILRQRQAIDVTDLTTKLGIIKAPTLVVHGNEDFLFPISYGKELATGIPKAKLVVLEGGNHMAYAEMADKVIPQVMGFLASVDGNAIAELSTPQIKH